MDNKKILDIPVFGPPTVEQAQRNAEGNKSTAPGILKITKETLANAGRAIVGVPRLLAVDIPLELAAKTLDLTGNMVGVYPITAYRTAKYIRDTRGAIKKVTDNPAAMLKSSDDHGHGAHPSAHQMAA